MTTADALSDTPLAIDIYQFRVYIRAISPAIWRRFLIPSDQTIADLHYVLQIIVGWDDAHRNHFIIHGSTSKFRTPGEVVLVLPHFIAKNKPRFC